MWFLFLHIFWFHIIWWFKTPVHYKQETFPFLHVEIIFYFCTYSAFFILLYIDWYLGTFHALIREKSATTLDANKDLNADFMFTGHTARDGGYWIMVGLYLVVQDSYCYSWWMHLLHSISYLTHILVWFVSMLVIETRVSYTPYKCSLSNLHSQPESTTLDNF